MFSILKCVLNGRLTSNSYLKSKWRYCALQSHSCDIYQSHGMVYTSAVTKLQTELVQTDDRSLGVLEYFSSCSFSRYIFKFWKITSEAYDLALLPRLGFIHNASFTFSNFFSHFQTFQNNSSYTRIDILGLSVHRFSWYRLQQSNLYTNTVLDGYRNHFPVVQFQNQAHILNLHGTGQVFKTIRGAGGPRNLGAEGAPKLFSYRRQRRRKLPPQVGRPRRPKYGAPMAAQFFFSFYVHFHRRRRRRFPKVAPEAPLPRRAREIPPKAGISRVVNNVYSVL